MINRFGQVNILIQAVVSEIYYISNHRNFISNHCTSLYSKSILVIMVGSIYTVKISHWVSNLLKRPNFDAVSQIFFTETQILMLEAKC